METQKTVNLLKDTDNEHPKFAAQKWCVIQTKMKSNFNKFIRIKSL